MYMYVYVQLCNLMVIFCNSYATTAPSCPMVFVLSLWPVSQLLAGQLLLNFKEVHPTAVKIFTVFLGSEVMTVQAALSCPSKSSSEAACHEEREHNIMHGLMYGGLSV